MSTSLEHGITKQVSHERVNYNTLISDYLWGLEPLFFDRKGHPCTPTWWNTRLSAGYALVEQLTDVTILPEEVVEFHDYDPGQLDNFVLVQLQETPVHSVLKFSAVFPALATGGGTYPAWVAGRTTESFDDIDGDTVAFSFPPEWFKVKDGGQLQILPSAGGIDSSVLGLGRGHMPFSHGANAAIPSLWRVQYIAGFHNQGIPFYVYDTCMKAAAMDALTHIADTLKPPGVTSMVLQIEDVRREYSFDAGKAKGLASMFSDRLSSYYDHLYGSKNRASPTTQGGALQQIKDDYAGLMMLAM